MFYIFRFFEKKKKERETKEVGRGWREGGLRLQMFREGGLKRKVESR